MVTSSVLEGAHLRVHGPMGLLSHHGLITAAEHGDMFNITITGSIN